ncbi:BREX-1 system adenine-specific DNA-methyltransferase PglX [Shewanella baltica]|uniref:BREX-1 system adenine-specific DNA-methyltransferase PglX n=1 Tax=Shewanella baltica TaxID=62322 RepID=UPI003D7BC8C2
MAFDQSTRNRLQKFVSKARAILGEEFTRQLQATYGLDPKQGTVAAIDSLTHLDNRQRQTAHLLRETLAHYLSTTPGKGEKDRTKQVLDRIVREQAFTVLNRLAALRMAEARGFLLESIAKAHSSKGFQLYRQLSGTAHGETGDAYRNYLFSLFDEFSLDLAVLFDRHSAQGRLFPRETALLELLAEINHHEIEHLWAEDETIGWIYQYFNSQEERKKMRAESQAPRNSRELAVRNQFFTPRYVVEFLTDNTLGRIWYEMTQGNTALVDSCRYLVRRPTEIFLKPGETAPVTEVLDNEALSQEELLKQPVYIPYRPLKDPRSIRMLDPACGSMHFGLYAFDLFERIYLEAWQLEQQLGPDAFEREDGQQALQSTFDSLEAFKQQIPKLIIEHNIHGVDIDPRAVQIAGLSLWQRAQRAWHQQGIKPQQRPTIVKSNIVCAEPMPGEKALLQEFTSKLNPPVLGQLLDVIFDKMQLAGEAGTLLKIEEEIQTAIHEAREQWIKQTGSNSVGDLFQAELDAATPQVSLGFDLRGIDDATFWDDAEQRILQALSDYADQAESNADQKRLFAEDAAKGFAFIDLCRKRFDVVLMNPPFGEPSEISQEYFRSNYTSASDNVLVGFLLRQHQMVIEQGLVGAITDRSFINKKNYKSFREEHLIRRATLSSIVDLGWGVLDDANVEVACSITSKSKNNEASFVNISNHENKELALCEDLPSLEFRHKLQYFLDFPLCAFVYDLDENLLKAFHDGVEIKKNIFMSYGGLKSPDSERFFRCWFEIPQAELSKNKAWCYFQNGSPYSPFYYMTTLVVKADGQNFNEQKCLGSFRSTNSEHYLKGGIAYGKRTDAMYGFKLRKGQIPSMEGHLVLVKNDKFWTALQVINSSPYQEITNKLCGQHKYAGYINPAKITVSNYPNLQDDLADATQKIEFVDSGNEISNIFHHPLFFQTRNENLTFLQKIEKTISIKKHCVTWVNEVIDKSNKLSEHSLNWSPKERPWKKLVNHAKILYGYDFDEVNECLDLLMYLFGGVFERWNTKLLNLPFENRFKHHLDPVEEPPLAVQAETFPSMGVIELGDNNDLNFANKLIGWLPTEFAFENDDLAALIGIVGVTSINSVFTNPSLFFKHHYERYTVSKRAAPIYWPLQTPSSSYTLWVYYHCLNEQTLYTCVNDFVEPKLSQVEQDLISLRSKSARSSQEEKELEKLSDLASELRDFRDELLRLARFWKPNLNDGVQITAAPLWKLFQYKAWQKKLKETWESLEKGDYDWAHLACSIWPERVLRKCHQDRSLAIAHDVEEYFWHEVEVPVKRGKKLSGETKLEWQPKELNEPALLAVIKQIKEERGL